MAIALLLCSFKALGDGLKRVKEAGKLLIGTTPGFLPFEMKTSKGEFIGFDVDMMRAFCGELGIKAEFVPTKWEGIIPGLMAKKFDVIVSGMTITKERARVVAFSDPYYEAGLKVLIQGKHRDQWTSWSDIDQKGHTIVVKLGTTADFYTGKHLQHARLRKLDNEADAAQAVMLGKATAFVFDKPYLEIYAELKGDRAALLPPQLTAEDFGLAARQKDQTLIEAFNKFLKKWQKDPKGYQAAYKRAFVDMTWKKKFPDLF